MYVSSRVNVSPDQGNAGCCYCCCFCRRVFFFQCCILSVLVCCFVCATLLSFTEQAVAEFSQRRLNFTNCIKCTTFHFTSHIGKHCLTAHGPSLHYPCCIRPINSSNHQFFIDLQQR